MSQLRSRASHAHVVVDAALLLAEQDPGPRPAVVEPRSAEARPARPRARAAATPLAPRGGKRGRRDAGRDQMLSEYLSSLGRIPLLSPEDERELAARLRTAEVSCWLAVLKVNAARAQLADELLRLDGSEAVRAAVLLLEESAAAHAQLEAVADQLRDFDDERRLIDALIAALAGLERSASSTLCRAELSELLGRLRSSRRAALDVRNRFVRANLRLVVSVARRFHHHRMPLVDLIQEGNLGLIKSVHRFDHRKGFRFSTYAHWWIRQAIERAIMNKGAQVRLPVHVFDARREVARVTRDLHMQLGREPTIEELSRHTKMPIEKLHEVLRAVPREPHSLEDAVGDEDRTLGDVLCDPDAPTPDTQVIRVDEQRWVRRLLQRLSPMEVDILRRRFGLDTEEDETLEEIGRSYSLSRERVRQIQVQGLKKIHAVLELQADAP